MILGDGSQGPVERSHLSHAPPTAARQMTKIPGSQSRMLLVELSRKRHILVLKRPHLHASSGDERQSPVERPYSRQGQVGVYEFLHHFRRSAQRRLVLDTVREERSGRVPQGMGAAHSIHEHVRVDEDHVADAPCFLDPAMTARCSSQSGSVSGPSSASHCRKNASISSADSNGRDRCCVASRWCAAALSHALKDMPSFLAWWTNRSRSSSGIRICTLAIFSFAPFPTVCVYMIHILVQISPPPGLAMAVQERSSSTRSAAGSASCSGDGVARCIMSRLPNRNSFGELMASTACRFPSRR